MTAEENLEQRLKKDPEPGPGEVKVVPESVDDYTAPVAQGRILFIDLKFLKLGITDKTLALALVLVFLILAFLLVFSLVGIFTQSAAVPPVVDALIKALFMALGVILARNIKE